MAVSIDVMLLSVSSNQLLTPPRNPTIRLCCSVTPSSRAVATCRMDSRSKAPSSTVSDTRDGAPSSASWDWLIVNVDCAVCVRGLDVVNRGFSGYNTKNALELLPQIFLPPSPTNPRIEYLV